MKEKRKITKDSISIMGGICFILLAVVILFSNRTSFEFLTDFITSILGFIGYWLFLPYIVAIGIFLILHKKVIKLKVGLSLWGVLIIIVCLVILTSHWASIGLTYNNVEIIGKGRNENGTPQYLIFSNSLDIFELCREGGGKGLIGPSTKMGGGAIGFIFAGAINSAITPLGLNIVCWIFFIIGLSLVLNHQIRAVVRFFLGYESEPKTKTNFFKEIIQTDDEAPKDTSLSVEPENYGQPSDDAFTSKPFFDDFHTNSFIDNSNELKKAKFEDIAFEETPKVEPKEENVFAPIYGAEQAKVEPEVNEEAQEETFETPNEVSEEYVEPFAEPSVTVEQPFVEQPVKEEPVDELHRPQPLAVEKKPYVYPSIELLNKPTENVNALDNEEACIQTTEKINRILSNLHIGAEVISHTIGPTVTRFDVKTQDDVSVKVLEKAITDLSVKLGGVSLRYEAVVSGMETSALELPNKNRTNVTVYEAIQGLPLNAKMNIPFGVSISGDLTYANLADFPHMLVAGTTGSGKSIYIHSTIISLLMRNTPDELKLLLIDPKKVEMSYYDKIPHLLCPVVTDFKKAYVAFNKLVDEMERRFNLFQEAHVRDIKSFNEYAVRNKIQPLPYIVTFIDEYADLIENCKEIRDPVVKISGKSRAAGIHLVIATQRPSVNIIDGVIKGNVATRVALMCASAIDSMTVIGEGGAETLLGYGDMLVDCSLISKTVKPRVQGCYITDTEIEAVCGFLTSHYQPEYDPNFVNLDPKPEFNDAPSVTQIDKSKSEDEQYASIKEDTIHREYTSISFIQRTYGMGFNRAGKIFSQLQREGIVSSESTAKGSKVLCYEPPMQEQQIGSVEQSTFIPDSEENK